MGGMGVSGAVQNVIGIGLHMAGTVMSADEQARVAKIMRNLPLFQTVDASQVTGDTMADLNRYMPELQAAEASKNQFNIEQLQNMYASMVPEYAKYREAIGRNLGDLAMGKIPKDVADRVQNMAASRAVAGGYAGSGLHRNLVARDLGLTSMDVMSQGLSSLESWMSMGKAQTADYSGMFMTANDRANLELQNAINLYQSQINRAMGKATPGYMAYMGNAMREQGGSMMGQGSGMMGGMGGLFGG